MPTKYETLTVESRRLQDEYTVALRRLEQASENLRVIREKRRSSYDRLLAARVSELAESQVNRQLSALHSVEETEISMCSLWAVANLQMRRARNKWQDVTQQLEEARKSEPTSYTLAPHD